jgi:D-sedoheptulose 7-phosphate isomerase
MKEEILAQFNEAHQVLTKFIANSANITAIEEAATIMITAIKNGNKIISCGNGGSMCDAMHFAEELTGKFRNNRPAIPAIAISDASFISCAANDYGYDQVFSRYVEGLGKSGDVLLAISTSGNSPNVLNAANTAINMGMKVVALTGKTGGELAKKSSVEIRVADGNFSDRVQEIHIKVIHTFIHLIEQGMLYA